jgi:hypothetical protein
VFSARFEDMLVHLLCLCSQLGQARQASSEGAAWRRTDRGVPCGRQTRQRGYGLRTLQFIPQGAYVGSYFGEMMTNQQAEHEDDTYLFDLDAVRTTRDAEDDQQEDDDEDDDEVPFCVSALRYGNVLRFANHRWAVASSNVLESIGPAANFSAYPSTTCIRHRRWARVSHGGGDACRCAQL